MCKRSTDDTVAFDTIVELCGNERRRVVLAALAASGRPLTVRELTEAVVEHDRDGRSEGASGDARERVRRALHHGDLPKLAANGVVEYDPDRRSVEPTGGFDRYRSVLTTIADADPGVERPAES